MMISVIIPVYKVELYIHQCIDSILNQTYRNLEILLIDDGSPDRCGEICEEYARDDSRIRVFHTENRGLSAARNLGLRIARGDFISFIDSDDWIELDMYEKLLCRINETKADICVCGIWMEYSNNKRSEEINENAVYKGVDAIRALILYGLKNYSWNKLYKKKCWAGVSFPENHLYEDISTTYIVFQKAQSVTCIGESFYHYRMRRGSIVRKWSMSAIKDFWDANYNKYLCLSSLQEINTDQECINKLKEDLAIAAALVWRTVYQIPRKEREYNYLYRISHFTKNNWKVFKHNNISFLFQLNICFTRHVNDILFALLYFLDKYRLFIRNFIKKNKTLYS